MEPPLSKMDKVVGGAQLGLVGQGDQGLDFKHGKV